MIWELVVRAFMALVRAIIGLLPTTAPPGWLDDGGGYVATALEYGSGLGAWINFGLAGVVVAAVLGCVVVGFTIKVVRIVASFVTAGGGSAA